MHFLKNTVNLTFLQDYLFEVEVLRKSVWVVAFEW